MNEIKEYLKRELGISDEQYTQMVEVERSKNVTKADLETLGNALVVTFQSDNQLGDLVTALLIEIEQLKARVGVLENA